MLLNIFDYITEGYSLIITLLLNILEFMVTLLK